MDLALQVVQTAAALEDAASRRFRPHGLSPAQFNVLNLLAESPAGRRAGDLAADLIVDPSNVTRLLQRLKRERLVRSVADPADGRAHVVVLTPAGRERWQRAHRVYTRGLAELAEAGGLRAAEAETVSRFLAKLRQYCRDHVA